MTGLALDARLAWRGLARKRWAAAGAALSLALGFGSWIAVVSCVTAVLWKPLAVPQPDRMATIYGYSSLTGGLTNIAHPQLASLRTLDVFESVAAFTRFNLLWETAEWSEKINVEMVSGNYFDAIRPPLQLGRPPRETGEIVLGNDFWMSRFSGSEDALGQTVRLSGERYVITGIMGREFRGTLLDYIGNPKVWITVRSQTKLPFLRGTDLTEDWVLNWFVGAARLRVGVTAEQAQHAVAAFETHAKPPAGATQRDARVIGAARSNFHPSARPRVERTLALCAGIAGLLLFLGCLNASFFLAGKALAESRQNAVESALGAGGARIARRRFAESAYLCVAALGAGTALAAWCIHLLRVFPPPIAMILARPAWDWRVWGLTAAWTALAILIAGTAPALLSIRSAGASLQSSYAGPPRKAWRLREVLVVVQVAVACAILVASGFVLRTVIAAHRVDTGFHADGLVMAEADLYALGATTDQRKEFLRQVVSQLRERPEIQHAAASALMPLTIYRRPSRIRDAAGRSVPVYANSVSDSYFETLRLPLLQGRTFLRGPAGAREAVVNETLARMLNPSGSVVGSTLEILGEDEEQRTFVTIVGVARDTKYHTLWQDRIPYYYISTEASPGGSPAIIARSAASPQAVWRAMRETLQRIAPKAILTEPRTGADQVGALVREQSYLAVFFGALGAIALVVAATGLMANLYLIVSQRTREIGIRQALGASRAVILKRVLARGMAVALAGLAFGLAAGALMEQWIRPLAPGTPESDPWPLLATFALLLCIAGASVLGPALKAASIQPWEALRHTE